MDGQVQKTHPSIPATRLTSPCCQQATTSHTLNLPASSTLQGPTTMASTLSMQPQPRPRSDSCNHSPSPRTSSSLSLVCRSSSCRCPQFMLSSCSLVVRRLMNSCVAACTPFCAHSTREAGTVGRLDGWSPQGARSKRSRGPAWLALRQAETARGAPDLCETGKEQGVEAQLWAALWCPALPCPAAGSAPSTTRPGACHSAPTRKGSPQAQAAAARQPYDACPPQRRGGKKLH